MSKATRSVVASERNKVGPNYFRLYACQIAELFSQDEDLLLLFPQGSVDGIEVTDINKDCNSSRSSSTLYKNGVGAGLSDFKREKLKGLLRQSVIILSEEVDELLDPIVALRRLQLHLRGKKRCRSSTGTDDESDRELSFQKKLKSCASTFSVSIPVDASPVSCESSKEDDLQFLLKNDTSKIDEKMRKYCDELSARLGDMEQQLEGLLNTVTAKSRPMTLKEKQHLRNLIRNLPPKNLERVAEIIRRGKPLGTKSHHEIHVDLEEEDNVTLWRLYYYTEAVEKAKMLSMRPKLSA